MTSPGEERNQVQVSQTPKARAPIQRAPGAIAKAFHARFMQEQVQLAAAMAEDEVVSADHVRAVILKTLDRCAHRNGAWQVEPVRRVREGWLFKAFTPLAPWPLAIKVYCSAMPVHLADRQHQALTRYHAGMASRPGLTVPAPWAASRRHRTLVMEWIEEPRADLLLRRAGRLQRNHIITAASRWLRHFHDQDVSVSRPLTALELLRPIDTPLGGQDAGASVTDPVFAGAYRALVRHAGDLDGRPISYVKSHGDFTPTNLFHGPQRTVGFDFVAGPTEPALRDILHFLAFADFERPLMTRASGLLSSAMDRQDLQAFLAAYGPLDDSLDARLIGAFRLAEVLRRWAFLLERMRRLGPTWRTVATTLRLRSMTKGSTAALDRA